MDKLNQKQRSKQKGYILVGKMCSGKTTTAMDMMLKNINSSIARFSFACPLKDLILAHYGGRMPFDKTEKHWVLNKVSGEYDEVNKRYLCQAISEAVKLVDYSFWFRKVAADIVESSVDIFIIDDCRFEEEFLYLRDLFNVQLIYIDTDDEIRNARSIALYNQPIDTTHVSEQLDWIESYNPKVVRNNEWTTELF